MNYPLSSLPLNIGLPDPPKYLAAPNYSDAGFRVKLLQHEIDFIVKGSLESEFTISFKDNPPGKCAINRHIFKGKKIQIDQLIRLGQENKIGPLIGAEIEFDSLGNVFNKIKPMLQIRNEFRCGCSMMRPACSFNDPMDERIKFYFRLENNRINIDNLTEIDFIFAGDLKNSEFKLKMIFEGRNSYNHADSCMNEREQLDSQLDSQFFED